MPTRPFRRDPDERVALVLSGGGARGAFQVGVYEVLRTHPKGLGDVPAVISGTSAGAINGYLIACGLAPRDVLGFWLGLADDPPVIANETFFATLVRAVVNRVLREPFRSPVKRVADLKAFAALARHHKLLRSGGAEAALVELFLTARFDAVSDLLDAIGASYVFDVSPLADRLRRHVGPRGAEGSRVRLAINTIDVSTGRVVRVVNHEPRKRSPEAASHYRYLPVIPPSAVVASSSIPLLFNPARLPTGELCWDGGLLVNTALAPTVALGATCVVPVLVTANRESSQPLTTFGSAVERLADTFLESAYDADRKIMLERNLLAEQRGDPALRVVELYQAIRPPNGRAFNAGSYLFFEKSALLEMYEEGKRAARQWLADGPRLDVRT